MPEEKFEDSMDPAAQYVLTKAREANIETAWDRFAAMQDMCAFGSLGLCCRICMSGPCRIDPFGEGPQEGVCGIGPDAMVARNLCRMIAAGASAHSDHGSHILEVFRQICFGETTNFKIKDPEKLRTVASQLGLEVKSRQLQDIGLDLIAKVKEAYSLFESESTWIRQSIPKIRLEKLRELGVLPGSIDPIIRETMHRTHMGVDADPLNLLMAGIKCSIADFMGMDISSNLSDIILGTPELTFSQANLGVIDAKAVNIALHGHNPLISESILQVVPEFEETAKKAGAEHGINIIGVCCTGNEVLMRHGIPLATNAASQELAILTGAIEAMVVDVQCIMPSLANLCECYHTRLITTMSIARIPGAMHVEFRHADARESARKIIGMAVDSFKQRDRKKVDIPNIKSETLVGFSPETIVSILDKVKPGDPVQALLDKIISGDIYGIVLFAGCNNYKVVQDSSFITIARMLAADNVLMLATGCAAGAFAKKGYLSPRAVNDICGDKLKKALWDLGKAARLEQPLPPIWHMGSCVDNSRAARLAFVIANKLNVDLDQLPLVASAPEAMSEKSVAIGTGTVALGITTHLGVVPPILGGKVVTKVLTNTVKNLLGARFIVESEPTVAYRIITETLTEKRIALGL